MPVHDGRELSQHPLLITAGSTLLLQMTAKLSHEGVSVPLKK